MLIVVVAACYVMLLTVLSKMRWAWTLGFIACFGVAAVMTPADPFSLLLVVMPLCALYTIAVFARRSGSAAVAAGAPGPADAEIPRGEPGRRSNDR